MELLVFQLLHDADAPKGDVTRAQDVSYRFFREGDQVVGYQHPDIPTLVVVDDEWLLPIQFLESLGPATDQGNGEVMDLSKLPAQFQEEMDRIKNIDFVKSSMEKSRQSVTWLLGGGLFGFFAGLFLKQNVLITTVVGATVFGVIGYNLNIPAMNKKLVSQANSPA